MNTVGHWLAQAIEQLRQSAITDTPELDAQLLACHFLQISRTRLFAFPETPVAEDVRTALDNSLSRRLAAEPIAYITEQREFWSMQLRITTNTLVPRADTEILVEKALELMANVPEGIVLDLGTGTGAIAIAVASEMTSRQVVAIERNTEAVGVAQSNLRKYALDNLHLVQGSWLDAIGDGQVAMVLANPPYLASDDPHIASLTHEPIEALVSGKTGLEDLEHIIADTCRIGKPGAALIVEHGSQQGDDVRQLLLDYTYTHVCTGLDLAGLDRISFGFLARTSL